MNNFNANFPEIWKREQGEQFFKINVAKKITTDLSREVMNFGDRINQTYVNDDFETDPYTRGTDIDISDKSATLEYLDVNRQFAKGFYVDDFDKYQSQYDLISKNAKNDGEALSNQIDADVLGEVLNSYSDVDDGDIGGTAGNSITPSNTNMPEIFSAVEEKLEELNIMQGNRMAVISPNFKRVLLNSLVARETAYGDATVKSGATMRYYDFDLYVSNQLTNTLDVALSVNPTATDTLTLGGAVYTFVSAIGTTAGNVLIGATVDDTRANLVSAITSPKVTSATYVAFTDSILLNQINNKWSAVNATADSKVTITFKGISKITTAETFTDVANVIEDKTQHLLFGQKGGISLAVQKSPSITVKDEPKKFGKNILNGVLYGYKTFRDGSKKNVNVKIAM